MTIELRPDTVPKSQPGDLDEVVATGADVHLEVLSDNAIMLIIEDATQHVHLRITHRGRSPIRVWAYETINKETLVPKIICLCGSTRFTNEMLVIQWEFSKQGNVVLGWDALPDSYFDGESRTNAAEDEGVKEIIDELHKRKIDLADEVFVLNVGGYVGESTRSEIDYAIEHGKPIHYLEVQDDPAS